MEMEAMNDEVYLNIWNGHFKVWLAEIIPSPEQTFYTVKSYWGAIGRNKEYLQSTTKKYFSNLSALQFRNQKAYEKRYSKGYTPFPADRYWELVEAKNTNQILAEVIEPAMRRTVVGGTAMPSSAVAYTPVTMLKPIPQKKEPPPDPVVRRSIQVAKKE
jgi:hypothetical protein